MSSSSSCRGIAVRTRRKYEPHFLHFQLPSFPDSVLASYSGRIKHETLTDLFSSITDSGLCTTLNGNMMKEARKKWLANYEFDRF
jgi:hypothetical protein